MILPIIVHHFSDFVQFASEHLYEFLLAILAINLVFNIISKVLLPNPAAECVDDTEVNEALKVKVKKIKK